MRTREQYHGWLVLEKNEGYKDTFFAEYNEGAHRRRIMVGHSAAEAVEWWDNKVGKRVQMISTPVGAYRVYTLEEEEKKNG